MKTNRRKFIRNAGTALASTALLAAIPFGNQAYGAYGKRAGSGSMGPFGFQIWTIRNELLKDFSGTLKKMAAMGYSQVEMCSPLGYGFKSLNEMSGAEMRKIIEDAGLKCTSSHFTSGELKNSLDNRIEWASQLGMKQMAQSMPGVRLGTATMDDWKRAAHELNKIAERTRSAGMQMVYHNHNFEFQKIDGELIYPVLMDELDPELVKMQFQVAVIDEGYKAQDYFRKYPGRFISAHLADYSIEKESQVPLGQGVVDWKDLFEAAKTGGVQNYFVEMDPVTFEESARFLLEF
ncbi:MAG: sugar phosphate isomerase/epimerase [Bacteroidales bacterium]|nr:sugar phosphate isomerase/epimerase [Bacteroidales bacterium]